VAAIRAVVVSRMLLGVASPATTRSSVSDLNGTRPARARRGCGGADPRVTAVAATTSGTYANLSQADDSPATNDAGMIAFWATLPTGEAGIFAAPAARTITRTGDRLVDSFTTKLQRSGLNNRGAFAFRAELGMSERA